jgi:hypothetical protein
MLVYPIKQRHGNGVYLFNVNSLRDREDYDNLLRFPSVAGAGIDNGIVSHTHENDGGWPSLYALFRLGSYNTDRTQGSAW